MPVVSNCVFDIESHHRADVVFENVRLLPDCGMTLVAHRNDLFDTTLSNLFWREATHACSANIDARNNGEHGLNHATGYLT